MTAPLHLRLHFRAIWDLFCFRPQAVERIDPSWRAARWSFALWLLAWPCGVYDSWTMEAQFFAANNVTTEYYIFTRSVQMWISAILPFLPVYFMCRWEGVAERFPRLVTTQNWQMTFWAVGGFIVNVSTQNVWFTHDTIVTIGISMFFIQLFYAWYFCWVVLKCNPFYAAGIATMLFMVASTSGDLLNIHLFGTARPFFILGGPYAD